MTPDHQERLVSAREIVEIFSFERYAHAIISIVSALVVIFAGCKVLLLSPKPSQAELTLLFGSGGLVAANAGMMMYMFNKITQLVFGDPKMTTRRPARAARRPPTP